MPVCPPKNLFVRRLIAAGSFFGLIVAVALLRGGEPMRGGEPIPGGESEKTTPGDVIEAKTFTAHKPGGDIVTLPGGKQVQRCQCVTPAAPHKIWAVDSAAGYQSCYGNECGSTTAEVGWDARSCVPWQSYAQGEYVGHARLAHVPEYRLRVDDQLGIYFLRTREVQSRSYQLEVGDQIRVESLTAGSGGGSGGADDAGGNQNEDALDRQVVVQPDGMITLPLLGRVPAAGRTIESLQEDLETKYKKYYRVPTITVTPLIINTRLEDLFDTVDSRGGGIGGRQITSVVTPAGKIQMPGLGSVYVQGLTLSEAKREIDARYSMEIPGVSVTVDLTERAQRFIYVLGEVNTPGRFELLGPTTVMQAIALAEGWNLGANLRQVVVFRRGPDWRLMATMVDVRGALYGKRPTPADEIWLNDSDIVLIPKTPIQAVDEVIEQFFTRGAYAAVPIELFWGQGFGSVSAITSF